MKLRLMCFIKKNMEKNCVSTFTLSQKTYSNNLKTERTTIFKNVNVEGPYQRIYYTCSELFTIFRLPAQSCL